MFNLTVNKFKVETVNKFENRRKQEGEEEQGGPEHGEQYSRVL
jgi:hypothetical protein